MADTPAPYTPAGIWNLNNRVNLKLLDALTEDPLGVAANPRARNVGEQFAHLHSVRITWLEVMAAAVAASVRKIAKGAGKPEIRSVLEPGEQKGSAAVRLHSWGIFWRMRRIIED